MNFLRKKMTGKLNQGTAEQPSFDPFVPGTKRLKAGYRRVGQGMIQEVETGLKAQF